MSSTETSRLERLLADALDQREKHHHDLEMFIYFDGKVSGLREALGLPIEDPSFEDASAV